MTLTNKIYQLAKESNVIIESHKLHIAKIGYSSMRYVCKQISWEQYIKIEAELQEWAKERGIDIIINKVTNHTPLSRPTEMIVVTFK